MRKVILVTGARAPSALHLARIFHSAGHRVILADTLRYPMSRATRMKDAYVAIAVAATELFRLLRRGG